MQTPQKWPRNSRDTKRALIPPRDALRSVVRKFMELGSDADKTVSQPAIVAKKVTRFSELGSNDRNVSIEVLVSHTTPVCNK